MACLASVEIKDMQTISIAMVNILVGLYNTCIRDDLVEMI